ncbi:hypothetical protein GE061_003318 [Apolygus lucorum]|uniref:Uncharacterized protein n=1 Tax=Apolygus lucorum TaxID=248454 RepID=A0A8S9X3K4_APOLU|nr:hypothetical protein GE061_003318 [Apolygus lucorum]
MFIAPLIVWSLKTSKCLKSGKRGSKKMVDAGPAKLKEGAHQFLLNANKSTTSGLWFATLSLGAPLSAPSTTVHAPCSAQFHIPPAAAPPSAFYMWH